MWKKGFEIPICVCDGFSIPDLGKFKRFGMDVVVNAVWLALYWARQEADESAATALNAHIFDWSMDFVYISGTTPEELEENKFRGP